MQFYFIDINATKTTALNFTLSLFIYVGDFAIIVRN